MVRRPRSSPLFPTRRSSDLEVEAVIDVLERVEVAVQVLGVPVPVADLPLAAEGLGRLQLRSEEHTSELQSLRHLVCRLLLEKKKRRTSCDSSDGTMTARAAR